MVEEITELCKWSVRLTGGANHADTTPVPLKETYHESIIENPGHIRNLKKHATALLVIDMQYLDAARGHGMFADGAANGVPWQGEDYYFNALERGVIPHIARLQKRLREHGLEVIHARIQSLTQDGRDGGAGHKRLKIPVPPRFQGGRVSARGRAAGR